MAARAFSRSRAAPTTCAPRDARTRAVSTPSPADTPVTNTRLPARSRSFSTSSAVEVDPNGVDMVGLAFDRGDGGGAFELYSSAAVQTRRVAGSVRAPEGSGPRYDAHARAR